VLDGPTNDARDNRALSRSIVVTSGGGCGDHCADYCEEGDEQRSPRPHVLPDLPVALVLGSPGRPVTLADDSISRPGTGAVTQRR
jgi:hypothetical protein